MEGAGSWRGLSGASAPESQARSSRGADQGAEAGQGLGAGPVVDPDAALLPVQRAAFVQHLEVLADRRLGQVERAGQVTHAGLAAGVGGHQGHQPEPDRVGERLQQRRDLLSLVHGKRAGGRERPRLSAASGLAIPLTLKVRPTPADSALVWVGFDRIDDVAAALDRLNLSRTRPLAVELLNRPAVDRLVELGAVGLSASTNWYLCLGYEDSAAAVQWQVEAIGEELGRQTTTLRDQRAGQTWSALVAVTESPGSPWAVRANVRPSAVTRVAARLDEAGCAVQAHGASGIVRGFDLPEASNDELVELVEGFSEVVATAGGNLVVERCPAGFHERVLIWGRPRGDRVIMQGIRAAFDPQGLMNPGRLFDTIGLKSTATA